MMLVSIEPARAQGVDLHTFECAVCNQVLATFAAFEDPTKSRGLGRWLKAICTQRSKVRRGTTGAIGGPSAQNRASPPGFPGGSRDA